LNGALKSIVTEFLIHLSYNNLLSTLDMSSQSVLYTIKG